MRERGYSLVEVMVAVGLGGIVSLGAYYVLSNQTNAQWAQEAQTAVNEEREEIALFARRRIPPFAKEQKAIFDQAAANAKPVSMGMASGKITFTSTAMNSSLDYEVKCESVSSDKLLNNASKYFSTRMTPAVAANASCLSCPSGTRARLFVTATDAGGMVIKKYPTTDVGGKGGIGGKYSGSIATNACISPPVCVLHGAAIHSCTSWKLEVIQASLNTPPSSSSSWGNDLSKYIKVSAEDIVIASPEQLGGSINIINK